MDFNVETATNAEILYMYKNSRQISMQTGLIGHLRADFGSGSAFFTTWFDYNEDKKTQKFKTTLDNVINSLRFSEIFKSRADMSRYCSQHSEAGFDGNYTREYGFKVKTDNHILLLRCNPTKGDYNVYCYCYEREWFENHLKSAEKGIRFITSSYNELFRIKDGDKIRIEYSNGQTKDFPCRYIDEYHTEIGNNLYHICEFAERMESAKNKVSPLTEEKEHSQPTLPQRKDRGDAR